MNKEQILRKLYKNKVKRDNFLDCPEEYREVVSASTFTEYVDTLHHDYELLLEATFGEHHDSVTWFLYDWQPGFEVGVRDVDSTPIHSIDEFIEWMKLNEGFE